jgi:hypothetical protein
MKSFWHKQWARLRAGQRRVPVGWQVVALVLLLVGGRYGWVMANRPAHWLELAEAYSINLFYGAAQPDSAGKRVTCVGTAEQGFAVYLVDTATGQKRKVQEQSAVGPWGSFFDLKVWPWAPDDRLFVFSASNHFYLCEGDTGRVRSEVPVPVEVATLTWVSPEEFVFFGRDEGLYRVQQRPSGLWQVGPPFYANRARASSQNSPREGAARAFDGDPATKWYNNNRAGDWWLQYQFTSGAPVAVVQYRLTSANDAPERDPQDWDFQGSNNGVDWTTLDTRQGEKFSARLQTKTYWVRQSEKFQSYRLRVTKQAGAAQNNLQLSEFSLFAAGRTGELEEVSVPWDPFVFPVSLQAISAEAIAWVSADVLWRMDLATQQLTPLLDCRKSLAANTRLHQASYSPRTGKFLLSCTQAERPLLYEFDAPGGDSAWRLIPTGVGLRDAVWLSGGSEGNGGLVARQNQGLVTHRGTRSEVPAALAWANIESMTISADGQHAFLLGTMTNEPAAGLWQFHLETGALRPVVAYAERPSVHARKIEPLRDFILTDSGKYTIYLPADFYQHPKRKYPLVIGDTDFGFAARGAYGRMWAPAMAAGNAVVVIVNRKDWFGGLEQWGDRVTAAVADLAARLPIDQDRMFLFAVSAETTHAGRFLASQPAAWRGIMFLNPSGLPEFSAAAPFQPMPKVLVSVGELEQRAKSLQAYQLKALHAGVLVEVVVAAGEKHHLVGNAAQRQRTRAMMQFVFGD